MGYHMQQMQMEQLFHHWKESFDVYAPMVYQNQGAFSDTDCIRYGKITAFTDIVFDKKSQYSFKEVFLPISQTLFYFTEDQVQVPAANKKGVILFLRSCDIHALNRLDQMYLQNGPVDPYYKRLRDNTKLVLIGCAESYENCFCVSMHSNHTKEYDLAVNLMEGYFEIDCNDASWNAVLANMKLETKQVKPAAVSENNLQVSLPEKLSAKVSNSTIWKEYDSRCINCGRCNFVCPTCTCFTMQDIFYSENGKAGERRRIWASCMVDGFSDVAGGGCYRKKNGERMRFKVLHKVLDYRQRNGIDLCVGCGRCDDICPEYISFSSCINHLEQAMKEVAEHEEE